MVEIITIGDEILIGQIVDSNSAWMAAELNKVGLSVKQISSVSDDESHIIAAIDEAFMRADVVLLTGGLGPTKDDITKYTLCKYFNTKLVFDPAVLENIKARFAARKGVMNPLTEGQAMVPEAATIIQNTCGTAPITWFEKEGKVLASMPGVPSEMKAAMSLDIIPRLQQQFSKISIVHHTVLVIGDTESALAIKLAQWEDALPDCIHLAYLPSAGLVKLRLSVYAKNEAEADEFLQPELRKLREIIGELIFAERDLPLAQLIIEQLQAKNMHLATAESCTGGNIAHEFTLIPGTSGCFKGSVVAYSNEVKENVLQIPKEILIQHGAVSEPVVQLMAKNILDVIGADISVAVSGIAGPGGGTECKPVGLIWIAVATRNNLISREFRFGAMRERNIQQATIAAYAMLKEILDLS